MATRSATVSTAQARPFAGMRARGETMRGKDHDTDARPRELPMEDAATETPVRSHSRHRELKKALDVLAKESRALYPVETPVTDGLRAASFHALPVEPPAALETPPPIGKVLIEVRPSTDAQRTTVPGVVRRTEGRRYRARIVLLAVLAALAVVVVFVAGRLTASKPDAYPRPEPGPATAASAPLPPVAEPSPIVEPSGAPAPAASVEQQAPTSTLASAARQEPQPSRGAPAFSSTAAVPAATTAVAPPRPGVLRTLP